MNGESLNTARLLQGNIGNLRKTRASRDFFFTDGDRLKMGATAVGAGLVGLGGIAVGLSAMAVDTSEEADLMEFDLDGEPVKAWVWCSVFKEGDEVEVVAERGEDAWHGFGILRKRDGIVALHPHCSRGRNAHYRSSVRWYLITTVPLLVFSSIMLFVVGWSKGLTWSEWGPMLRWLLLSLTLTEGIFGVIALRIARKFMGFVRLAEGIFTCFGWKDVKNIDLPALTKKTKGPNDPGPLGVLYFRCQP